jgi:hypothetical protein
MSPILDSIQEKVYERPIPYLAILGHSGSNRELLMSPAKDQENRDNQSYL